MMFFASASLLILLLLLAQIVAKTIFAHTHTHAHALTLSHTLSLTHTHERHSNPLYIQNTYRLDISGHFVNYLTLRLINVSNILFLDAVKMRTFLFDIHI